MYNLDDLLKPDPASVKTVQVNGQTVYLRPLASCTKDRIISRFSEAVKDPDQMEGMTAEVVAGCLCDSDGVRLDLSDEQLEALRRADSVLVDRLFEVAQEISGIGETALEDAEKN